MSTTNQPGAPASGVTAADLTQNLTTTVATADGTALQRIQTLDLAHQARVARLTRAAANATKLFGAGSPQAASAQAAEAGAKTTAGRVAMVHQQAGTPAPQVAANGWVLHGRVYNASLQPVSAYCVFLVDSRNAYQSTYGFAYTDATGYFSLSFSGMAAPQPEAHVHLYADVPRHPAAAASPELFVEIANTAGQPVYLGTQAFQPTLGMAAYQNFTLPDGENPLGDPPPVIRNIAFPSSLAQTQASTKTSAAQPS